MKIKILLFAIPLLFVFCSDSNSQPGPGFSGEHPIQVQLKEKGNGLFELELFLPPDFGFQKEAPHRISLSGLSGLKVKSANLSLSGPSHPKKAEYFEYVKPLGVVLEGKGKLEMNAKLFYCNFKKNICIPANLSQSFSI
ncbi:hypothetical protein P3G55_09955 [Leptospira sp. 96542]|nr:hypothetical protein [Leptospira sp. 96542]